MTLLERAADYKTATFSYYRYYPSEAAAIVFCVLFSLLTIAHLWKLFRTKTWFFIPFVIGGIFEAIGYGARAFQATQSPDWTLVPFIITYLLILLAPSLLAASMYMMLGRIIHMVDGDRLSIIRRTWLTKIFVMGDVISFFTQAAGGGIQASAKKKPENNKNGEHIILVGLIIQVVFFVFFIIAAGIFHWRMVRTPTTKAHQVPWLPHMMILYATNSLILIRCVFRAIEYGQGNKGYLLSHESFLYIFDASLMFIVVAAYIIRYPNEISDYLRRERTQMHTVDGGESGGESGYDMVNSPYRVSK